VAVTRYGGDREPVDARLGKPSLSVLPHPAEATTAIYRFSLEGGRAVYRARGEVPGFVLDLADPRAPRVLGFGKDTVEAAELEDAGPSGGDPALAYYQGLKVALFDVSDVAHPVEKFKVVIGARGTDSELLRNHKALLFSREKNLLAFPVTLMEVDGDTPEGARRRLAYGRFTFQGAYVYRLDPERGFLLQGRITHLTEEDYRRAREGGHGGYPGEPLADLELAGR